MPVPSPGLRAGGRRTNLVRRWCALCGALRQPWRCLCRRFSQITMTRPCRRITLHLSQIFLTLGLTFTASNLLLVPVDDPTAGQVVRRELHHDPVFRKDADVVLPHLAADVR